MSDGYVVRARLWGGAAQAGQAVLYLHGIQSHGGWFERSASVLAAGGLPVLLPDRRGSGCNDADRGDTPHADRWLMDLDELASAAERECGAARFGVVGVSWGGKLAVAWALRRPERVSALLLIAPGLFPAVDVGLVGRLRIGVSRLADPRRLVRIPLDDPALFTDNPDGQAYIAADPLKLTHATARFFFESARLDWRLVHAPPAAVRVPVRLLLAGRERIIRNAPTLRWLSRICAAPVHVREFEAAAHTLEFEPDPQGLEEELQRWRAALGGPETALGPAAKVPAGPI